MAAVSSRSSSRRRSVSEINMVPFIDVMLVLLVIFMVSAPLMTTGIIDVPTVGQGKKQPDKVIEVWVQANQQLKIRIDKQDAQPVASGDLSQTVKNAVGDLDNVPVVIAGEKSVKYEDVVKVMDVLRKAGIKQVGLLVKTLPT